ncbi:RNA deprotection pyrophosphohydrolase [Alteribacillus sp. YIM 98480]|uniref:RNA deprotection pyrophosphohydrolase n=1 Tax=Alteribacillus sp. YIM 98480 TaxID=2606599 RepID=UPI00131D6815|nr:nucleoside triphosphatase YtkD [Alteribacillus sp. YIM 98480]
MKKFTFLDYYQNEVQLAFEKDPFSETPGHVWVVCRYQNQWLLTLHPRRGIEFPGGKVEPGEMADRAARREVWEETGGKVARLFQVGQYKVHGKAETVVKNIYYAEIKEIEKKANYMETKGPVVLQTLPKDFKNNTAYSFIMKDEVLPRTMMYLEEEGFVTNS